MKETLNISIASIAFTIDADAYTTLNEYLARLNRHYSFSPDGREIIADIETRIAELVLSRQENKTIIGSALISEIISQLGMPEDMDGVKDSEKPERPFSPERRINRRLYRSKEGGKIAGVCSGIGKYFDIDPVIPRLIFIIPLVIALFLLEHDIFPILVGISLVPYFILWIAVPKARTPLQKLELEGGRITAGEIEKNLRYSSSYIKTGSGNRSGIRRAESLTNKLISFVGTLLLICVKVLLSLLLVFCLAGLIAVLVGVLMFFASDINCEPTTATVNILVIAAGLMFALPFAALGYYVVISISGIKGRQWIFFSALWLWIASTVLFFVMLASNFNKIRVEGYSLYNLDSLFEKHGEDMEDRIENARFFGVPNGESKIRREIKLVGDTLYVSTAEDGELQDSVSLRIVTDIDLKNSVRVVAESSNIKNSSTAVTVRNDRGKMMTAGSNRITLSNKAGEKLGKVTLYIPYKKTEVIVSGRIKMEE